MAAAVTAGAVAPAWHEAVREHFQVAWDALDRAQIVLYRQSQDTGQEQVERFKERFDAAVSALVDLAVDEFYAPYATDVDIAADDPDEESQSGGHDQ